jgi:hypothetical protein
MWIIDWYTGLNGWARFLLSLVFFVAGDLELWLAGRFRPWVWGLGVVFLMFCIPEKKNKWGNW